MTGAMIRTALALTLAALTLAAAPAVASAGDDRLRVFFPGDCVENEYKPKSITVFCADDGVFVKKISYDHYGARRATGTGVAHVNECVPNCAAGTYYEYDVRIRLSRVKQCGDVPQFTRLRVIYPRKRPNGFARATTQRFGCADAPTR